MKRKDQKKAVLLGLSLFACVSLVLLILFITYVKRNQSPNAELTSEIQASDDSPIFYFDSTLQKFFEDRPLIMEGLKAGSFDNEDARKALEEWTDTKLPSITDTHILNLLLKTFIDSVQMSADTSLEDALSTLLRQMAEAHDLPNSNFMYVTASRVCELIKLKEDPEFKEYLRLYVSHLKWLAERALKVELPPRIEREMRKQLENLEQIQKLLQS